VLAVVAIGGEKFTRSGLEPDLQTLAKAMPSGLRSKCNVSSIAAATGINRETVRRKVLFLQTKGILQNDEVDGIHVASSFAGSEEVRGIVRAQVDAVVRATDQLRTVGVFKR
jgi:DNA-binding IclR family transcriptional regulator